MCDTALQKRCQELLPVIQAGAEGKTIQSSVLPGEPMFPWEDVTAANYGCKVSVYHLRVKPEPKYRPFTAEEAIRQSHRKITWKSDPKKERYEFHVGQHDVVAFAGTYVARYGFSLLVDLCVFEDDGSPCGVLIP